MKTKMTLNEADIVAAVTDQLARRKQKVKDHSFKVEQYRDAFDRPGEGYTVELEIEVEDDFSCSQR